MNKRRKYTEFAGENGLILAINKAGASIYRGILKAADVSWISSHREKEYIVLPTTFHKFSQVNECDARNRGWIAVPEKNPIYITNYYKSNKDILCPFTDDIHKKATPIYNDVATTFNMKDFVQSNSIAATVPIPIIHHSSAGRKTFMSGSRMYEYDPWNKSKNGLENRIVLPSRSASIHDEHFLIWKMIIFLFTKLNDIDRDVQVNKQWISWLLRNTNSFENIELNNTELCDDVTFNKSHEIIINVLRFIDTIQSMNK